VHRAGGMPGHVTLACLVGRESVGEARAVQCSLQTLHPVRRQRAETEEHIAGVGDWGRWGGESHNLARLGGGDVSRSLEQGADKKRKGKRGGAHPGHRSGDGDEARNWRRTQRSRTHT